MELKLIVSDIHIHLHVKQEDPALLNAVLSRLGLMENKIMSALDDLQAAVTAEDTVIDSAITLIQGIPALIAAAGVDPAKLSALQADITGKSKVLADAVAANTPAATPPAA